MFINEFLSFYENIEIPNNIKLLRIDVNKEIDNLPSSIEQIYLHDCYKNQINDLPNSVKYIKICDNYFHTINNLPDMFKCYILL